MPRSGVLAALALVLASCSHGPRTPAPTDRPYVLVLGTAQDAGFPQIGANHARARAARADPTQIRRVASLLVVDPRTHRRWLIDATPDLPLQVEAARGHPAGRAPGPGRPPLFEGIFLTHAHMGHYAGLLHLGREAYAARGQPVHGSARMTAFLETQAPWELLVRLGHITLHTLEPDRDVELASQLTITPILVPHRAEYTDTLGFIVRGPSQSLLYIPDIDKWHQWERRLEDVLATVDHALIDGTFYADGEIPGRSMKDIPHPFIAETMARLASASADLRAKVRFTHLNHTNPAADPGGSAQKAIEAAGFSVARDGDVFGL